MGDSLYHIDWEGNDKPFPEIVESSEPPELHSLTYDATETAVVDSAKYDRSYLFLLTESRCEECFCATTIYTSNYA